MATKTTPRLPSEIDPRLIAGALERMQSLERQRIKDAAMLLSNRLHIHHNEALELLVRCAWAESGQFDQATSLCGRLNGAGGADERS